MKSFAKLVLGVATCAIMAGPAVADTVKTTTTVTQAEGTYPDGTHYERHTVIERAPIKPGHVTFYYYDPNVKAIVAGNELTDDIIALWDTNNNRVIDNREFYQNALVVYEPIEYTKRTFQDIDGVSKLTKEEYTLRLQQLPSYRHLNKDGSEGLNLWEFLGVGFQDADLDNNNQVSYDELRTAFYVKEGLVRRPLRLNN